MNNLINSVYIIYANEARQPTPPLRFCLAIYLEGDRNDSLLRHDHAGRKTLASLEPLDGESRGFYYGGLNHV